MCISPYLNSVVRADMEDLLQRCYPDLEAMRGKRLLIAGANGMLARYMAYIVAYSNEKGFDIALSCLVRNEKKGRKLYRAFLDEDYFDLIVGDVCNQIAYSNRINYIVHAASSASPKYIRTDPVGIIRANTLGTMNLLEVARANKGCRLLLMSTREVYGEVHNQTRLNEHSFGALDPMDLRSCYPESKRMGEQICASYHNQYGVPSVVARIAHSYGPGMDIDNDGRVMSDIVSDAVNHRDIVLNSDGSAIRAFCYVTDAVAALFKVLVCGEPGEAYNISNETEPTAIRDVASMLSGLSSCEGITVQLHPKPNDGTYTSYERIAMDNSKIMELGWKPTVALKDGLERTVRSFSETIEIES